MCEAGTGGPAFCIFIPECRNGDLLGEVRFSIGRGRGAGAGRGVRGKHLPHRAVVKIKMDRTGASLAVQWFRLHIANAGGTGFSGQGTKFPAAGPKI